ncbi:hypothetical protein Tco_0680404 [Tanacetum coccineum]|uniref:Uncharacterized protein n=1 Tax=Tanacetum coccineum TaxID=301880 RepID=A0ABQ4XLC0_9ASTR
MDQTSKAHFQPNLMQQQDTKQRIAKLITDHHLSLLRKKDSDPEQAQMDKEHAKNLALIALLLLTARNLSSIAKECRKAKTNTGLKNTTYHKEKMLLCKQAEKGVQLQVEQSDWLADTDEEIDEQELSKSEHKEKHDELVKQSLLTKSHYEGLVKEKTKVITDLKLKEEKDIDKMISMENQIKFLNEIVYKKSQSIQTIHMLALKCPTFNGRPTFANRMYLKKAQYEKPCLYEIQHDQSDLANRLIPDREDILTLEKESRSKLNKDLVKPYD